MSGKSTLSHATVGDYVAELERWGLVVGAENLAKIVSQRVRFLTYDSREVVPGSVFICKGAKFNPQFLADAVARGAVAAVGESTHRPAEFPLLPDLPGTKPSRILGISADDPVPAGPLKRVPNPAGATVASDVTEGPRERDDVGSDGVVSRGDPDAIDLRTEEEIAASEAARRRHLAWIEVSDVRQAMARLGALFYRRPWDEVKLIGITGTKGKSTTAYFVKSVLDAWRASSGEGETGLLSSIRTYDGVVDEESHLTTPETLELFRHLRRAADAGLGYVTMEVSSQGLKYDRLLGVQLDAAAFLNLGEDHISPIEHPDYEDYVTSKLKIFHQCDLACVNLETAELSRVLTAAKVSPELITFMTETGDGSLTAAQSGRAAAEAAASATTTAEAITDSTRETAMTPTVTPDPAESAPEVVDLTAPEAVDATIPNLAVAPVVEADLVATDIVATASGVSFMVTSSQRGAGSTSAMRPSPFRIGVPGRFNVSNALAAIALCRRMGVSEACLRSGLAKARVPGRMEVYQAPNGAHVIVDYAHNIMSFDALFDTVDPTVAASGGKIAIVFGCPGDKALGRRAELGTIAGRRADRVYLTEEDPGSEDVLAISQEVAGYVEEGRRATTLEIIPDRAAAIHRALADAGRADVVLITGKGRETRQKRGDAYVATPSDVEIVEAFGATTPA
jgi:UDP-N-acetylmuramoyl-L-alanyl-D-glutamate--2,6-diaminopimelate ligase